MNAALLERFIAEIHMDIAGRSLRSPAWFPPVLAVPVGGVGVHLVAILETPGPFCYLADKSPFGAAHAPIRFRRLDGARIIGVAMHDDDRILRIDAMTRNDREPVSLHVRLYGASGGAALLEGGEPVETIGTTSVTSAERARPSRAEWPGSPFYLQPGRRPALAEPSAAPGSGALGPFDDARAACHELGVALLATAHTTILHRLTRPARRKLDAFHKLAVNLESDVESARDHARERREAETLAAFQSRVPAGSSEVTLPDVYDASTNVRLELDPTQTVPAQIEKRFRRAAKLEKSGAHAERRLELVRRETTELEAALALLERAESFEASLRTFEVLRARFGIELEGPRITTGPRRKQEKTYRQFELDPRWFAVVGRSNHENDEVTFKVASPTDYWFHARGVAGSHVVLKSRGGKDGPPARIIQHAASLAAYFSKARHSGLVPVVYTLRKYVRKFRGAQPGQVTCERETLVMVPPTLPGPVSESS